MTETESIATRIQSALLTIKRGSLRFWGNWFGRPYDNLHALSTCQASGTVLLLTFDEGERLSVWAPSNLKLDDATFQIADANRVLWEWYSYRRPQTPENLFFKDFTRNGEIVTLETNVDRYPADLNTNRSMPAVELLWISRPIKTPKQ